VIEGTRPCPHCGGTSHWWWKPGPDLYAVACKCGATGPVGRTEDEAVGSYNRRFDVRT
jgi:hypothetical protein